MVHFSPSDNSRQIFANLLYEYDGDSVKAQETFEKIMKFLEEENEREYVEEAFLNQTPQEYQDRFGHMSKDELKELSENENTSPEDLALLSHSNYLDVRLNVAVNRSTPVHIMREMIDRGETVITSNISYNENLPEEMLVELTYHADTETQQAAAFQDALPQWRNIEIAEGQDEGMHRTIAHKPGLPVDRLIHFSESPNKFVRARVAANPELPVEYLVKLSKDEVPDVRAAVGSNPNTPKNILAYMAITPTSPKEEYSATHNEEIPDWVKEMRDL